MNRLDVLKKLCNERGISINKLEQELGFSQGSLGKINSNVPKADKLYAIARYFDVPMEVFFDSSSEARLYTYYNKVKDNYLEAKEPVYDVACGQGRINGDYSDEYVEEESEEDCSWCKVCGESMSPILTDGDLVKVRHMTQTEPTDLTAIKVDGESSTIKYVEVVENGIWLRAENKDVFEDKFYSVQEVLTLPITIIGKVVELKRKF